MLVTRDRLPQLETMAEFMHNALKNNIFRTYLMETLSAQTKKIKEKKKKSNAEIERRGREKRAGRRQGRRERGKERGREEKKEKREVKTMEMRKAHSFGIVFTQSHMPRFAHRKGTLRFSITHCQLEAVLPVLSSQVHTHLQPLFYAVRGHMGVPATGSSWDTAGMAMQEAWTWDKMGSL